MTNGDDRRRELLAEEADMAARLLEAAEVELVATRPFLTRAVTMAVTLRHSAHDCMYLAVAEALELPLVTADAKLVRIVRNGPDERLTRRIVALGDVPPSASSI